MVYITGDIHGVTSPIYNLCRKHRLTENDVVILLGDVGANYDLGKRDCHFKKQLSTYPATFFCVH